MTLRSRNSVIGEKARSCTRRSKGRAASWFVLIVCWAWIAYPQATLARQAQTGNQESQKTEFGSDPQDDTPLVDREPFDTVFVEDGQQQFKFLVKPLGLDPSAPLPKSGMLRFELLDRAGQILQLPWSMVRQVKNFDQVIVEETRSAYERGDLDTAFRNLIYLFDRHGRGDPMVQELLENFWYRDAQQLIQSGNHYLAATVLEELYQRNPGFTAGGTPVIELLATGYDRRIRDMAAAGDVDQISAELDYLLDRYPTRPPAIAKVISDWTVELQRQGQKYLDQVAAVAQGTDPLAAQQAARRAIYKLPEEPRSWQIYDQVMQRFPMMIVGVSDFANRPDIRSADNWAARRTGGLLEKLLVDLVGLGEDGGQYDFADGRIVPADEFGMVYRFEILPTDAGGASTMTALELARRLGELIREQSPEFYFPLAKLVESIAIVDESRVEIQLRQPFARFECLLRVPYQAGGTARSVYELRESNETVRVYYPLDQTAKGKLLPIVEQKFASSSQAASALIAGEIDVIDRVFPSEIRRLQGNPAITVRPYLTPSIHVLIPNQRTRFMKDQTYRRSLLYAIDRNRIVEQLICGGKAIQGFTTISGPLPRGSDENDLIGYGYDARVRDVAYSPAMAIMSPNVVISHLRKKARDELIASRASELDGLEVPEQQKLIESWLDQDESIKEPTLVVAHPATEMATVVCQSMVQMWSSVGRKVELRALPPGETRPTDDNYDLLYAELTIEEPLVDLRNILGELGLAKQVNATVGQLIAELDTARNWVQARQILRQIHEQCSADATVLPLWQTINFYAYRNNVQGLGESEVRLYDHVDRWSATPRTKE